MFWYLKLPLHSVYEAMVKPKDLEEEVEEEEEVVVVEVGEEVEEQLLPKN